MSYWVIKKKKIFSENLFICMGDQKYLYFTEFDVAKKY